MEQIKFIHSPDCHKCIAQIDKTPKRKMADIALERSKYSKCKGCTRVKK